MKVSFPLFLFFIFLSGICFGQAQDDTLLLAQTQYFIYGPNAKMAGDSIVYSYDSYGFKTSELHLVYEPGNKTYRNSKKYVYTNDSWGYKTSFIYQNWNGTTFKDYYKITYTYNSKHQILTELMEMFKGAVLENYGKTVYQYNSNFQLTSLTKMDWQGAFVTQELIQYTYDPNGKRISELKYTFDGSSLSKDQLNVFTYDANNNLIKDSLLLWDDFNSEYVQSYVSYFGYNPDGTRNYLSRKRFDRSLSKYINEFESNWSYNSDKNPSILVTKKWNESANKFDEDQRYLYDYNIYKKNVRQRVQAWNTSSKTFGDVMIYYYYYKGGSWTGILAEPKNDIKIYPVPVKDILTFETSTFQNSKDNHTYYVEIISPAGVSVIKKTLSELQNSVNLSSIASGTYTLVFYSNQGAYRRKFIKL